jgi:hypothetical protein
MDRPDISFPKICPTQLRKPSALRDLRVAEHTPNTFPDEQGPAPKHRR